MLSVTYENVENSKVNWYRNNQLLEQNGNIEIKTSNGRSIIKIIDADKKKVGKYEVVIEKDNQIVKSGSSVKLYKPSDEREIQPPAFTKLLKPSTVRLGDAVLLEVTVHSSPPASFTWFIGSQQVARDHNLDNIYVTTKDNASCLCIESLKEDSLGTITCRAENFAGSVSCSASLQAMEAAEVVGMAPRVLQPLRPITVMDGDTIELTCALAGWPTPHLLWHRDGAPITRARDVVFSRWPDGLSELSIREAFPEMTGIYRCTAFNDYGTCCTECHVTVEGICDATCMSLTLKKGGIQHDILENLISIGFIN